MTGTYQYSARNARGARVSGTVAAASREDALELLHMRALATTSIDSADSLRGTWQRLLRSRRALEASRIGVFRGLATLVRAGVPLRRALEVVAEQCESAVLADAVLGAAAEIERGARFSEALRRHPREFPAIVAALVNAGEVGGILDTALERIATLLERSAVLKKRVAGALVYPAIVAGLSGVLVLFLLCGVVPSIVEMFRGFDVRLPAITVALIALGQLLRNPWFDGAVAVFAAASVPIALLLHRIPALEWAADRIRLRIPIVGPLIRRADTSACARTLGSLLVCGVSLNSALETTAAVSASLAIRRNFLDVAKCVALGQRVTPALAASGLYEPLFLALVRAGEESGSLGDMLLRAADAGDADVERTIDTLSSVLEPALIIFLGGAVGTIVAAVLIPLYSIIGNIT